MNSILSKLLGILLPICCMLFYNTVSNIFPITVFVVSAFLFARVVATYKILDNKPIVSLQHYTVQNIVLFLELTLVNFILIYFLYQYIIAILPQSYIVVLIVRSICILAAIYINHMCSSATQASTFHCFIYQTMTTLEDQTQQQE